MVKFIFTFSLFMSLGNIIVAQNETREELEKKRLQLKKEYDQVAKMLNENRSKTKENFVQWKLINDKVALQDKLIDNINRDINILDNNIYTIQLDVNHYNRLLDTLRQEYAKSMVYAYKNRNNYDFVNFIFSAASFNDAIKRIAYLKSYRNYRAIQGENILRTQELRKKRIEELSGVKQKKNIVLRSKDKEMAVLESQKFEKDKILTELKKQGKQLNDKYVAIKRQATKVNNAINAAIARAKKEAIAKAKAEAEKLRALEAKKTITTAVKNPIVKPKEIKEIKPESNVLLNSENIALNNNFEKNKGSLPWPVDNGRVIMHYGSNKLPSGGTIVINSVTVATNIGTSVKAVFDGVVSSVFTIDDMQVVMIQHGRYFTSYSNLTGVSVQKGQAIKRGQVLGRASANLEGIGAIDFILSNDKGDMDPERWLRSR